MRVYKTQPPGPSPRPSSIAISRSMQSNRGKGTRPELVLSRALRKRLTNNDLPGSPDFVYRTERLAVFVHGCFWHRCPVDASPLPKTHTTFWKRKFARNVERDTLNREELQSMGWKVIEIWEHEVKANPRACAERVLAQVRTQRRAGALD
jgi:DNA mismatch endonuclease, patch repair protein